MSARIAEREQISLRLIDLIKPHKVLFDSTKLATAQAIYERRELWNKIAIEMNHEFNMKLGKCISSNRNLNQIYI